MTVMYTRDNTKPGEVNGILTTPGCKIRRFNDGTPKGRLDLRWVLQRSEVPNLTDDEWFSAPSIGDWLREETAYQAYAWLLLLGLPVRPTRN